MRLLIFTVALLLFNPAHADSFSRTKVDPFARQTIAAREVQVTAVAESTPGSESGPVGSLSSHIPEAGWAQIPGSSPNSILYYPKTAEADIGKKKADSLCPVIWCFQAQDEVRTYSGMASTPEGLYLLANGGHSSMRASGVLHFSYKTLKWERRKRPTGPVEPPASKDPAILNAAYAVDRDGDGVRDDCLRLGDGPFAGHTYDGVIWIPDTDYIIWMGTTAWCFRTPDHLTEMTAPWEAWLYDKKANEWEILPPEFQQYVNYSSSAYDPASGTIYLIGRNDIAAIHKDNPRKIVFSWRMVFPPGFGSAEVDQSRRKLYMNGTFALWEVPLDATGRPVDFLEHRLFKWPKATAYWANQGMALHEPTGRLVFWDGRHRVQVYDPETKTMTRLPQVCNPSEYQTLGIYSKWDYLPQHDAFIGVNSYSDEVVLYKLPEFQADGSDAWLADHKDCTNDTLSPAKATAKRPAAPKARVEVAAEPKPSADPPAEPEQPVKPAGQAAETQQGADLSAAPKQITEQPDDSKPRPGLPEAPQVLFDQAGEAAQGDLPAAPVLLLDQADATGQKTSLPAAPRMLFGQSDEPEQPADPPEEPEVVAELPTASQPLERTAKPNRSRQRPCRGRPGPRPPRQLPRWLPGRNDPW